MANCALCGKKLGLLSGSSLPYPLNYPNTDMDVQVCDDDLGRVQLLLRTAKSPEDGPYLDACEGLRRDYGSAPVLPRLIGACDKIHQTQRDRRDAARAEEARKETAALAEARRLHEEAQARLQPQGYEGYYEYKVLSFQDDGAIQAEPLAQLLCSFGREGWRLRASYANEMGQNWHTEGETRVNTTVDQHVLILERFVSFRN